MTSVSELVAHHPGVLATLRAGAETGPIRLANALRAGDAAARAELFDTHVDRVERVLLRVLGRDADIPDLVQDVFERAFRGARDFRGGDDALRPWITRIAVFTARGAIRRRRTRRWLRLASEPEPVEPGPGPEVQAVVSSVFGVLQQLPPSDRIPLSLRWLEQMELTEIAAACDVSLATIKRRIARARIRFEAIARRDPLISAWIKEAA